MTLKDLLRRIEESDILETGWGDEPVLTETELDIWLEQIPRDLGELAEILGLEVETDYTVFHDDSGACEGYALLTGCNSRIVATLDYRLPEYCDDECDGSGNLSAVVAADQDDYDRLVAEKRLEQWRSALRDSLMSASGLLRCAPLAPQEAMRALLEELLPREDDESLRFLDAAVVNAAQELQEDSLRDWLEQKAPRLARIEWREESAYDDMGGFYTYLDSITLVAGDGERFLLDTDDDPFWRCEQFQTLEADEAFGDQDPVEAFAAHLGRKFGYGGDFWLFWNHVQSLVAILRGQGVCSVELRPVEQEADHAAA